jgi:hypothetical protein
MGLLSRSGGLLATPKSGDSSLAEPAGVGEPGRPGSPSRLTKEKQAQVLHYPAEL